MSTCDPIAALPNTLGSGFLNPISLQLDNISGYTYALCDLSVVPNVKNTQSFAVVSLALDCTSGETVLLGGLGCDSNLWGPASSLALDKAGQLAYITFTVGMSTENGNNSNGLIAVYNRSTTPWTWVRTQICGKTGSPYENFYNPGVVTCDNNDNVFVVCKYNNTDHNTVVNFTSHIPSSNDYGFVNDSNNIESISFDASNVLFVSVINHTAQYQESTMFLYYIDINETPQLIFDTTQQDPPVGGLQTVYSFYHPAGFIYVTTFTVNNIYSIGFVNTSVQPYSFNDTYFTNPFVVLNGTGPVTSPAPSDTTGHNIIVSLVTPPDNINYIFSPTSLSTLALNAATVSLTPFYDAGNEVSYPQYIVFDNNSSSFFITNQGTGTILKVSTTVFLLYFANRCIK